jgi:hypothetical protein
MKKIILLCTLSLLVATAFAQSEKYKTAMKDKEICLLHLKELQMQKKHNGYLIIMLLYR